MPPLPFRRKPLSSGRTARLFLVLAAALVLVPGCTAFPLKTQQVWRSASRHDYPSAPIGTDEFEAGLDRYTGSRRRPVTSAKLLQNGEEAYPEMLRLIREARHTIVFETYIIENDDTTETFFQALKDAAGRGVRVRVLVDAAGFHRGFIARLDELTDHGVEARVFNPFLLSWTILRGNNRDHRKILVADGRHAVLGGINLSDIQDGDGFTGWRDTALRISGPGALDAERVFMETWSQGGRGWVGKNLPIASLNPLKKALDRPFVRDDSGWPGERPVDDGADDRAGAEDASVDADVEDNGGREPRGGTVHAGAAGSRPMVRVVSSSPDQGNSPTYDLAILGILGARERLDIASAYFVPPYNLRRAILSAARRSVRVRLLVPGVTDVRLVREMGLRFYGELLEAGVRIYEWQTPILHAKTMVADGKWLVVGSANMDSRSYFLNYESCLALSDPAVAREAHADFDKDVEAAVELTLEKWRRRGARQKTLERVLVPVAGQY